MTVFLNENGNNTYRGSAADYDQVDYDAPLSEFSIFTNSNGSVTVSHPTIGTDTLFNIDGLWSHADQSWYSIEDAIALTPNAPGAAPAPAPAPTSGLEIDSFGVLRGTDANDVLVDTADTNSLQGGLGNDTLIGTAGQYSQAEYDGSSSEYTFTQNADGSLTVSHAVYGTDTLTNIDGFWFQGEGKWFATEELVGQQAVVPVAPIPTPTPTLPTPSNDFEIDSFGILRGTDANDLLLDTADINSLYGGLGNDTLVGTAGEYSQAEYDGAASEYTFTQNANGSVTVSHPVYGTDTLTDIDGFWFQGEQSWYALEELVNDSIVPVNPPAPVDPAPTPTAPDADGTFTGSNDSDDFLVGGTGDDTFVVGRGNDRVEGGAGNDTLIVEGGNIEWTFSANADGSVTMTHPTWGANTLVGIENIQFQRDGEFSVSIDDAIAATAGLPRLRVDDDTVLNGTNGDDVLQSDASLLGLYGGTGNDVFFGSDGFDQVNYDGARSEYTIFENGDGSITVDHPIWGTDTLNDIDGLLFTGFEPGADGAQTGPAFDSVDLGLLFA